MRQKIFLLLALLCVTVQGAWAQDEWSTVYTQTQTTSANWTALEASTTGRMLGSAGNTTYYYATGNLNFTNSNAGGSGLTIQGTVYLYIPSGTTLTCTGANASGQTGGGAGIELTQGNSLYLIGGGTLNATGGKAANGGNGAGGNDAEVNVNTSQYILGGSGGTGGNGGGGAGAGIGTCGGNGGTGGTGGQRTGTYNQETTQYGVDGNAGTAGATAGAMGSLYIFQSLAPTVNANGGSQGSNGSGGNGGRTASQHPGSNVYMAAGGGGGGAGGFGGVASNIGTGGPGGGGGGGGAAGNVAWVLYSGTANGYYHAGAYGGDGGKNADGSSAPNGADVELDNPKHADIQGVGLRDSASDYTDDAGWENGNGRHDGGAGGAAGSASVGGSYGTVTVDWSTQEDDWNLVCLRTNSTRADWVHLADNSTSGKTLGAAGTTTYYYTAFDRTFSNSNAGGSGLTILGTVYLYIPSGKTITCTGANATASTGGGAGVELTAGNTLYIIGSGRLVATGGNAANGSNGADGGGGDYKMADDGWVRSGDGGRGGDGGGAAGAGIGSRGGNGGAGGAGGAGIQTDFDETTGNAGGNGSDGGTAAAMGTLYVYEGFGTTLNATGGSQGTTAGTGGAGGQNRFFSNSQGMYLEHFTVGGGGGGAGGGFGGAASNIGTGGPGGGGGGAGSSGTIQYTSFQSTFYQAGAKGGSPGVNADGTTTAGAGESTLLDKIEKLDNKGWQGGYDNRAAGGSGGGRGAASVGGSANAVTAGWPTQGKGIEDAPFIVSSTDDWNEFANYVNGGYAFCGNFVKLGDDISVSTMAGTSDANSFQGTFDGNSKTLTFTKGTSAEPFAEEYCAPFRHVKNAVIKNLHVAGTIYTSRKKAAGIVGESHGALTITGCISSVNINSSVSGDGTHGGLVSTLSGENNTIIIEGCVFDGSFATTNGTINCGGFIGWGVYNKPAIKNSLMKPGSVAAGMLNSTFARWYTGNEGIYEPTIDNCYYVATDNLPTNQGTPAVVSLPDVGSLVQDYGIVKAYEHGIFYGGTYYLDPDKLSGYRMLNTATAEDVGKVVCAAGHLHDAQQAVPEGCTAVGVLGKVTSTGQGLILALQDATPQTWETINGWEPVSGYAGTTLKLLPDDAARGSLASYTLLGVVEVSDWCVAQKGDYETIFANIGTNAFITSAGGTALSSEGYWSASMTNDRAWFVKDNKWNYSPRQTEHYVRPVLGFAASAITVTLADNADNSTTISSVNGCEADVTLAARTLYKDGAWNTICLPFDVTIAGSPLAGATARPLTSASISGSTLTLTFGDAVTTLVAGTPYIIKWAKADGYDEASEETRDLKNPVFSGVTIDATMRGYDTAETSVTTDERVRFVGTYKSTAFNDTDNSILLMGGSNTLYYPTTGAGIGAQRAYFKIGSEGALLARRLTSFNIGFGEDDVTGIQGVIEVKGVKEVNDDSWYSLDGRRLNGKPSRAGVYINKGIKVVIK